jgi:hypothetical protein
MSPELKSNLLLSGASAVIILAVFYFWSRGDKERPTVKTYSKILITSFVINFSLFYALHNKLIPASVAGCPALSNGSSKKGGAPWKENSISGTQMVPNPAKFTAVDLNEPAF